ncbi:MAG: hypothetical protein Q7J68_07365 [Thermoplasmata archaeon]|nr:hypothetical protein [Thermoplasmata archaeon]
MVKLTNKKIKWMVDEVVKKSEDTGIVASIQGVSQRRVQQLVKFYNEQGRYPVLDMKRRPRTSLTEEQKEIVEKAYGECYLGARLLRHHIRKHYGQNIPQNKIHQHLLSAKLANPDPKKQKKRKRCRYERKHSLSLAHADWLEHGELQVIAYEDDASRNILALGEFTNATTDNAIEVLNEAMAVATEHNGVIFAINTDRGSQFYANAGEKKKKGISRFEQYLMDQNIRHIPSKRNNPQTNGKIERWFQEYIKHRQKFDTARQFMDWYNNRIHGSLRLDWGETPSEAFIRKMRPGNLLGMFLGRIEKED